MGWPRRNYKCWLTKLAIVLVVCQVTATLTVAGVAAQTQTASPAASKKPNIVFILTDDLDASSYVDFPQFKTQLEDQGTSFDHYFVTDSLCCPSRASTLRGQYPHNTQIVTNVAPNGGFTMFHQLGEENSTIGVWMQSAGYKTVLLGKYLNGYPAGVSKTYIPPGWNEWDSPAAGNPYSEFNYTLNENGRLVPYGSQSQDYETDVLSAKADDFITHTSPSGQPFFMYLATYAPHQPATPAPRYANAFPNAKAPRTPSFNEPDVSDKPDWVKNLPPLTAGQISTIDALYRTRLQSMLAVDDLIGHLVQTLQATGQLDNTYIVFASDNGFHLGQHRLAPGKQTAYEEDIRVPLVVRGPGVPQNQVDHQIVANIDLAPTFAQWAGATVPSFVDGRSFVPLLSSQSPATWRQAFMVEHLGRATKKSDPDSPDSNVLKQGVATPALSGQTPAATTAPKARAGQKRKKKLSGKLNYVPPTYHAMRTANYVYVEYTNGQRELYDLGTDPNELNNLAAKVSPGVIQQLSARLAMLEHCSGASCKVAEDAPVPAIGT